MRKINLFLMAVLVAFVSFVKVSAKTAIEGSPADIDFSKKGNYMLFYSADETLRNVDMTSNEDKPFGYYAHRISNGTYQKFPNHYATIYITINSHIPCFGTDNIGWVNKGQRYKDSHYRYSGQR